MLFQLERSSSARLIDSGVICDGDCTAFRQVTCFTERSDQQLNDATP